MKQIRFSIPPQVKKLKCLNLQRMKSSFDWIFYCFVWEPISSMCLTFYFSDIEDRKRKRKRKRKLTPITYSFESRFYERWIRLCWILSGIFSEEKNQISNDWNLLLFYFFISKLLSYFNLQLNASNLFFLSLKSFFKEHINGF